LACHMALMRHPGFGLPSDSDVPAAILQPLAAQMYVDPLRVRHLWPAFPDLSHLPTDITETLEKVPACGHPHRSIANSGDNLFLVAFIVAPSHK
jgi:hypothetical protein